MDASSHNNVMGITNLVDGTRSQQFTYDQLNRLLTAESTSTYATSPAHCWGEAYVYDNSPTTPGEYGNLTNINVASTAYNGCTQESLSVASNNNNQITTFAYDAAGNTLNDLTNGCITGQVCYAWYADGHLAAANGTTYYYDVHGNRVQKAGSKWYWYGLGSEPLDESDTHGNITDEYVYFGGKRVSHRVVSTNALYFYGDDMLGTSRTIFTSAGVLCYDADFYPFGGERPYTNTCAQNYKFTGKERDAESGLDNFGARYFGSSMGRFTSADPLLSSGNPGTPQTWNRYAYALNNPLRIVDPTGLWDWDQSAGGDMSDEDLQAIANDKHNLAFDCHPAPAATRRSIGTAPLPGPERHKFVRRCHLCRISVRSQAWRSVKPQRQAVDAARLSHTRADSAFFIPTLRERRSLAEREADATGIPTRRRCNMSRSPNRPEM